MKYQIISLFLLIAVANACKTPADKQESSGAYLISPVSGETVKSGESVTLEIKLAEGDSADSVVYFVDEQRSVSVKAGEKVNLPTSGLKLGGRMITARIYREGKVEELTSNIIIKSAQTPQKFTYQVEAVFPHDTSSYTQGLEFHDGIFYESDGEYASSTVRKVALKSGKVLKKVDFPDDYFAEGLTVLGNRIILLTWQENMGFVLDKSSLEMIGDFPYQNSREGWGLCNDGTRLYKSDGSNLIYFLNKNTYQEEGSIEVYDHNGPVNQLNELEFIDGKIYANVYQTRRVVMIDPKTGAIVGEVDFSGLTVSNANADVLNGIAFDAASRRLWFTGKKWDKLFQIKLIKQ